MSRSTLQSAAVSAPAGPATRARACRVARRVGIGGLLTLASIAAAAQLSAATPAAPATASSVAPVTAGAASVASAPQALSPAAVPAAEAASAPRTAQPAGDVIQFFVGSIALLLSVGGLLCLLDALQVWPVGPKAPAGPPTDASGSPDRPRQLEGFHFRRHWGGFGSESSGWDVSAPLMRLVVGMLLLALGLWLWMLLLAGTLSGEPAAKTSATASPAAANPARSASAVKG